MPNARQVIATDALDVGQYTTVITLLSDPPPLTATEWRLLGLAYLRSGRITEAETPLLRASTLGDPEGQVEYGNLLRASGRFDDALTHFENIYSSLTGELQLRCLRWWGTAEFQQGLSESGLARCERAWYGYLAMGDDELTGRVTQTLAQMHTLLGNIARAKHLFYESLRSLNSETNFEPRIAVLQGLSDICIREGDLKDARKYIFEAKRLLSNTSLIVQKAHIFGMEAEYYHAMGDSQLYAITLEELRNLIHDLQDYELRSWTAIRLADLYSLQGKHSKALEALHDLSPTP